MEIARPQSLIRRCQRTLLTSSRRQIAPWHRVQQLGTSSFVGILMFVTSSWAIEVPSVAATSTNWQLTSADSLPDSLLPQETSRYTIKSDASRLVVDLPNALPPSYFPVSPGGVVNVPPVQRPERSIPSLPSSTIPPVTLPTTVFPTNQTPSVSVPSLQPIPRRSRTPGTTSQPLERSVETIPPDRDSSSVIEFGQPLPRTIDF